VALEETEPGRGRASWPGGGCDFATVLPDPHLAFPALPGELVDPGPGFLEALREVSETAPAQVAGRAIDQVLLQGKTGRLVGTDGRQLLAWGGFQFPWADDVLVPRLGGWASRELPRQAETRLGRDPEHVLVRLGPWDFALRGESADRFPRFEQVVPSARAAATRLRLGPESIDLLRRELPRLPGASERPAPIALVLGPEPVVEVSSEGQGEPIQLKLTDSQVRGRPCRVGTDRRSLLRALALGFTEVEVSKPRSPLCCRDLERVYVWMPLERPKSSPPAPSQIEESAPMPEPRDGTPPGADGGADPPPPGLLDPLAEAEALRGLLQQASARLARLLSALRLHRKQNRAVELAVRSLKKLGHDC
jgi:hypothetical protein